MPRGIYERSAEHTARIAEAQRRRWAAWRLMHQPKPKAPKPAGPRAAPTYDRDARLARDRKMVERLVDIRQSPPGWPKQRPCLRCGVLRRASHPGDRLHANCRQPALTEHELVA
jgi:hypothetical protein